MGPALVLSCSMQSSSLLVFQALDITEISVFLPSPHQQVQLERSLGAQQPWVPDDLSVTQHILEAPLPGTVPGAGEPSSSFDL